ncbi:hypothetical protein, partial [Micromonospora sp. KC207]|uniref:hypothetical protein n=1 Tax=Micromonospora sp. KC207 TaxID=2530377 RepID=UPI001A9F8CEA
MSATASGEVTTACGTQAAPGPVRVARSVRLLAAATPDPAVAAGADAAAWPVTGSAIGAGSAAATGAEAAGAETGGTG